MWDFGERFKDRQKTRRACFALIIKREGRHNTLEYAIQLKNVTKTFGKVVANKNVNLDVKKGEILSLLGENGSGKTTLMNMISGIYFPDSG